MSAKVTERVRAARRPSATHIHTLTYTHTHTNTHTHAHTHSNSHPHPIWSTHTLSHRHPKSRQSGTLAEKGGERNRRNGNKEPKAKAMKNHVLR